MEKRYSAMELRWCEDKLKGKTAHFRLPSAFQKLACLSSLIAELRRAKRASGPPWVRLFGKSTQPRNFGYAITYIRPPAQTVGGEVGRQDSLWGRECSGNFPWREIAWKRCIWQPAYTYLQRLAFRYRFPS